MSIKVSPIQMHYHLCRCMGKKQHIDIPTCNRINFHGERSWTSISSPTSAFWEKNCRRSSEGVAEPKLQQKVNNKGSCWDFLAGPTRREWGKFHPQYTNVKVEGPSFPTGRASQFLPCKDKLWFQGFKSSVSGFWLLEAEPGEDPSGVWFFSSPWPILATFLVIGIRLQIGLAFRHDFVGISKIRVIIHSMLNDPLLSWSEST